MVSELQTGATHMTEVTDVLIRYESGEPGAADQLLPLVYDQLRDLAKRKLARENVGQTLQATALVHEAWLRIAADPQTEQNWNHRGHFFAAAAEAMRRILVERTRAKRSLKRGGDRGRVAIDGMDIAAPEPAFDLIAIDEALCRLEAKHPQAAAIVKFRYFVGLTIPEIAETLQISTSTVDRSWAFARAWLHLELRADDFS